jgi:excinuclease ABC subunit C
MAKFDHKSFLKTITQQPGVYQMFDSKGQLLYVGKAKKLKNRLNSYFVKAQDEKTLALVNQIADIQVTLTNNEVEALVLEHNLIKTHHPRYNILLRDDKSYPYIQISTEQKYPRMDIYRGAKQKKGQFFGPYPNAYAARKSLHLLQKLFKIRQCRDTFFANRSRPCLQYQIKRCTAPCVEYIKPEDYQQDVQHAIDFLQGKTQTVLEALIGKMDVASHAQKYEEAALYRDQIEMLQQLVREQHVNKGYGYADVCVVKRKAGYAIVTQLFIRQGQVLGHKYYYFKAAMQEDADLLSGFIGQYYLAGKQHEIPPEIICNLPLEDKKALLDALEQASGRKVKITHLVRKEKQQWLKLAANNAVEALNRHLAAKNHIHERLAALEKFLQINTIQRMECFDISHTQGNKTVASCVVFDREGALKQDYRRFNIEGIQAGDDYAALEQALTRHYKKRKSHDAILPDLVIIDGGKGQLNKCRAVMEELQLQDIPMIAVSKGPDRKPGEEQIWLDSSNAQRLPEDSPALHLLQQIRDEAHRFAIVGHRARRRKEAQTSSLENIPGIGPLRRQALLKYFGGLQGLQQADVSAIAKVPGMSRALAQLVYDSIRS